MTPILDAEQDQTGVPASRRALLFVNRKARNGGVSIDPFLDRLREGGLTVEERPCAAAGAMVEEIRAEASGVDCIIVGGGDGTLNCAAPALRDVGLPFGILPLGTANDLARTLGIPAEPLAAAEVILDGHRQHLDIGEVNGRLFFNVASIGFSAELARGLTREAKRRFGVLGYALEAVRLLVQMRPFTAYIDHDGATETVKTVQVSVGNGRHYGGGLTVADSAEPDDGWLDVYSLDIKHWWQLLALAPALKRGTHGRWRDVRAFKTTAVTVRTRRPRVINTDGELTGETPASFRILPRAVEVYAPEAPSGARLARP